MTIAQSATIHRTADVAAGAVIGGGTSVGPFCVIGPDVALGDNVVVKSHAVITGWTEIGDFTVVFPFACVGEIPQDLKYQGERTRLIIGKRNRIREGATLNGGTRLGGGVTRVGNDCLFMTGTHVGHDCRVGDGVIMANHASLGGHCVIGDNVIIGGLSGVHQFVRIGKGAIIGAVTMVRRDVIPHGFVQGPAGELEGVNLVGLRRRGADGGDIRNLRSAYNELAECDRPMAEKVLDLQNSGDRGRLVDDVIEFVREDTGRSLLRPLKRFHDENPA